MYKYSDNDTGHFSLHDCRATKLTIGDHKLTFEFEDGFYLCGGTMLNQYTGKSEVSFTTTSDRPDWNISVYLIEYLDTDEDSEEERAIRTSMLLDKFTELLKNGAELEFIDEYSSYEKFFYDCVLWYPKGEVPRTVDCQIFINAKDITYRWNEIKTDD